MILGLQGMLQANLSPATARLARQSGTVFAMQVIEVLPSILYIIIGMADKQNDLLCAYEFSKLTFQQDCRDPGSQT